MKTKNSSQPTQSKENPKSKIVKVGKLEIEVLDVTIKQKPEDYECDDEEPVFLVG